jgi:hypothetical protein
MPTNFTEAEREAFRVATHPDRWLTADFSADV